MDLARAERLCSGAMGFFEGLESDIRDDQRSMLVSIVLAVMGFFERIQERLRRL